MPRTVITPQAPAGAYAATGATNAGAAADTTNNNASPASGKDLIVAYNTGASPYTVTVTSAPMSTTQRTGDATATVPANSFAILGPYPIDGWRQPDGNLYYQASNAAVKFVVIPL